MNLVHTTSILIALAWALPSVAQDATFSPSETIKATVSVITKEHLRKPSVDERFCELWLNKYLESLDPSKLYFLAADISEFESYVGRLPELAKIGDTELLKIVSERYQLRAETALKHALDRIDREFDFAIDENVSLRYEKWPKTNSERIERWRLQLKYDLLVERLRSKEPKSQIQFLRARYESIRKQTDGQTEQQAVGRYLDSFCRTADPHSGYLTQKELNSYMGGMLREYSIGLKISTTKGRAIIHGLALEFSKEPAASQILGCELLAIRSQNGVVYNCREIAPSTTHQLVRFGLGKDDSVTLELYDEVLQNRFAINWPRK